MDAETIRGWTENGQPQEPEPSRDATVPDRLTRLRTTGFRKLRPGRIHVRCYSCGRKMSNMGREEYDPPTAVLIETPCEKCAMGGKDPESFYFDAAGEEIVDNYCEVCGAYLDGGMVERASDTLCVECAEDAATDSLAGAPVPAVELSRSTPDAIAASARPSSGSPTP